MTAVHKGKAFLNPFERICVYCMWLKSELVVLNVSEFCFITILKIILQRLA